MQQVTTINSSPSTHALSPIDIIKTSRSAASRSFLTTSWDDGSPLDFRVAALLARYNLPGTFYIPRTCGMEFFRPTMGASSIRLLSKNFEIGGHTLEHLTLTDLSPAQAKQQIQDCKAWVQDVIGKPCTMFCPPRGKYNKEHLSMIQSAGFIGLRTVEMLSIDRPRIIPTSDSNNLILLPTTIQAHPHGRLAYLKNIGRRVAVRNLCLYLSMGAKSNWLKLAESLARRVMRSGGVFHLWGHSWEIERTGQWRKLEGVFRMLSDVMSDAAHLSNGNLAISRPEEAHLVSSIAT